MKSKLRNAIQSTCISIFVLTVIIVVIVHQREKQRIFVVHSYNTDLAWVNEVDEGIDRYFKKNPTNAIIRRHYMNLKNHPDCHFYRTSAEDVRLAIQEWKPHVLIIIDDLAQALVGTKYLRFKSGADTSEFFKKIAQVINNKMCPEFDATWFGLNEIRASPEPVIVFAGVNGNVDQYQYPYAKNVTGVFEKKNYQALLETINTIHNASTKDTFSGIQMLNEASATTTSEERFFNDFSWQGFTWHTPAQVKTFDEWKTCVEKANREGSLLLIANYLQIHVSENSPDLVPGKEIISWTEDNAVYPVLGASTAFVADGGMMTVGIAGTEQGEIAAFLTDQILKGTPVSMLPYHDAKQFIIGLNKSLVKKRSLKLPLIYEAFSRQSNNFEEGINKYSEKVYMVFDRMGKRP
jgi:hypothetical protein